MEKYLNFFDLKAKIDYKIEVLSGLTVALALVPEAVAFALIAGLSPLAGLYAAFVMGLVTALFGGRPGMISGATGAVAVVIVVLAKSHGVEVVFGIVAGSGIDAKTVGNMASIEGGFPLFHIPFLPFTFETLQIIFPFATIVAGVGLIESLLTLNIVDEITDTRGCGNKEAVAQGAANIFSGFFSGMGGCAMIGQSLINVSNGARARVSGVVAAVMLLVFVMFGSSLIEQIPMAALTGLMIMVSIGTFEWASLRTFTKMPRSDIFVMALVTLVTALA